MTNNDYPKHIQDNVIFLNVYPKKSGYYLVTTFNVDSYNDKTITKFNYRKDVVLYYSGHEWYGSLYDGVCYIHKKVEIGFML